MMKTVGISIDGIEYGGGVYYTQSLIDIFQKYSAGHYRVKIVTSMDAPPLDTYNFELVKFSKDSSLAGKVYRRWLMAGMACKLARPKCLYRQMHEFDFIIGCMAEQPPLFFGKKFAFTMHDLQEKYFPENFSIKTKLKRRLLRSALINTASAVLCESGNTKDDIVEFFHADSGRIKIIPLPPTTRVLEFEYKPALWAAVREKYQIEDEYVFYPAQFWPHKNHIRLLEAFASAADNFPGLKLVLTGSKLNNYVNVKQAIESLSLSSKVIIPGYVEFDDLMYLCKHARLMVMPSLFESISIPVFEAFAAGVPVCASALAGIKEQAGDAALLFDPLSISEMTTALVKILSDRGYAASLAEKGKSRLSEFSQQAVFARFAELIDGR